MEPPRVATFHVAIEADDEEAISEWLNMMVVVVNTCAVTCAEVMDGQVRLLRPVESGQEIPVIDHPLKDREDV